MFFTIFFNSLFLIFSSITTYNSIAMKYDKKAFKLFSKISMFLVGVFGIGYFCGSLLETVIKF